LEKLVARHGWLAVVAAAATPLPDDIIFLLLAVGLPFSTDLSNRNKKVVI
jgi:hypothetical protein